MEKSENVRRALTLRLTKELFIRLRIQGFRECRSANDLIAQAIKEYLDKYEIVIE